MTGDVELLLDGNKLTLAANILRAVAHPERIRMLEYLDQQGSVPVNKIYVDLDIEQSQASQQLKILRDAKLVLTSRLGKYIYYSINYSALKKLTEAAYKLS